jgi:CheY-like chemotaxis protein
MELLRGVGHDVAVAYDGPQALVEAARFNPDIAILDIGLPVMDGYELARRLIATLGRPPYLIALTGYGQENDRQRARDAG